jgi:DNA-directed RNA polymerase alpha subunit
MKYTPNSPPEHKTRNMHIIRQRCEGKTYDAIAKNHGISRERVRQIIAFGIRRIEQHDELLALIETLEQKLRASRIEVTSADSSAICLNVGVRAKNAIRHKFSSMTIAELSRVPDAQILQIPNTGRKALQEIRQAIAKICE